MLARSRLSQTLLASLLLIADSPATLAKKTPVRGLSNCGVCENAKMSIPLTGPACAPKPYGPQVSCCLSDEPQGEFSSTNLNVVQRAADVFAWQALIALNWPARGRGIADQARQLADAGPRVWETWKSAEEIFLPMGAAPARWNRQELAPAQCGGVNNRALFHTQKVDDIVDQLVQSERSDPHLPANLTDQAGHLIRYETRFNQVAFDYIVQNKFYDSTAQSQAKAISFPAGSMIVKAAWRQLEPTSPSNFITTSVCLCDARAAKCEPKAQLMGLVGLHIMIKTTRSPNWIWSSFEQVDNIAGESAGPASFSNAKCDDNQCPPNRQRQAGSPNQLVRLNPILASDPICDSSHRLESVDNLARLNGEVRHALATVNTPLAFYQLIGTQVAKPGQTKPSRALPSRVNLANTTMESFVQDNASCMGCHARARSSDSEHFVAADYSFSLNNAFPTPPILFAPEPSARDAAEVRRGYQLATETFERLPKNVGAKLHCTSCHLRGGAASSAAAWVGVVDKYQYPKTDAIFAVINRCFEHSMNGQALCADKASCVTNQAMQDLLKYLSWLNQNWKAAHSPTDQPPSGVPAIAASKADGKHGAQLFAQHCAVCHGRQGGGRYPDNLYFRPALSGLFSYDACSPMATPATLAAFIQSNMPLGSGGLLSAEDAWDLESHIDGQCRPGKKTDANGQSCPDSPSCGATPAPSAR